MIVLLGHSGSGKDTILNMLVACGYKKIVSYTSRPPRTNEIDGDAYHFISEEEFKKKSKEGFFAEEVTYHEWYYGISKEDCLDDRVVVVEPWGLRQLKKLGMNVTSFFIKVDERERIARLNNRGDDVTELTRRIISDRDTFRGIEDEVDYVIEEKTIDKVFVEVMSKLTPTPTIKIDSSGIYVASGRSLRAEYIMECVNND